MVAAVRERSGPLVPDVRDGPAAPAWVRDPFGRPAREPASAPLAGRYEVFGALAQRGKGGVYAALHRAGMTLPFPQREVRVLRDATDGPATVLPFEAAAGPGRSPSDTGRP